MKEAGLLAIYKCGAEQRDPATTTLCLTWRAVGLQRIPGGLWDPLSLPPILGNRRSSGFSPVCSGKGLWGFPVVTSSLWFYIWKHPILVFAAAGAPHQGGEVRWRPAPHLLPGHTHFRVSQALLSRTGPCHQMAAQTSAEAGKLAALTWNSWKRTLHSFLCINTGGSVHPPAAAWTKEFPLSKIISNRPFPHPPSSPPPPPPPPPLPPPVPPHTHPRISFHSVTTHASKQQIAGPFVYIHFLY